MSPTNEQPYNKADMKANVQTPGADGGAVQMRSELDDLPILQAMRMYKRIASICMMAAFSAALESYQLALTNSIVANKGFIRQMSGGGTVLNPDHVALWGGMLSTGQFVGVGLLQLIADKIGRKNCINITWLTLVVGVTTKPQENAHRN